MIPTAQVARAVSWVLLVALVGLAISLGFTTHGPIAGLVAVSAALLAGIAFAIGTGWARRHQNAGSELANLSRQLQQLTEKEKAQLARSLHDELGGLLIAVKMDVSWLQKRWPNPAPEVQARWERVFKVLDEGVDFKRRVVEQLRPTLLDNMGLIAALRWIAQEICGRAGLNYIESYPEQEPVLSDDVSILVFRVVQEALNNVVKHAHATDVRIELTSETQGLTVLIEDNGVGIGAGSNEARRSAASAALHGLAIMQLRVSSLGGTLEIESPREGGTLIRARLPARGIEQEDPVEEVASRS